MKREKVTSCLLAAVLAFLMSFGGVGCVVTAFRMDGGSMVLLALACGFFAAVSAACFQLKWGGTLVLCLLALASGFLWHNGDAMEQLAALLYRVTDLYDRAYGWGVLRMGTAAGYQDAPVSYPMGVLGCLVAVCVTWTVCRRRSALPAVLAALLPLFSCLVVTDTVPREGYLYLLLLGVLLLVLTNGQRRNSESQGNVLTLMTAVPTALALGLLFLAVPQESYVNPSEDIQETLLSWVEELPRMFPDWTGEGQSDSGGDEKTTVVDLRKVGPLVERHYPVMEVSAAISGTMYLRDQDYDSYDGTGWTAQSDRSEIFGAGGMETVLENAGTVTIVNTRGREYYFLPYYSGETAELTGGRVVNADEDLFYEFTQYTLPANWRGLLEETKGNMTLAFQSGTWTKGGGNDSRYLELPDATRQWAEELVGSILTDEVSTTDKAEAIAAYVRSSAVYDTDTEKMPADADDFARWFLTESDTGYCVHFASATAVLLRAADIRARYVTGYMFRAVEDSIVTVRADQSHAWVEYYEPQLGLWMVLESTPADGVSDETTAPALTETTAPPDPTDGTEQEETLPPPTGQDGQDPEAPDDTAGEVPDAQSGTPFTLPDWAKRLLTALLWLALGAGAVSWQRTCRLRLRRKKLRTGSTNAQAIARWREAELLYRRLGQTPPRELAELAQKAKFSQHTLTAEELQIFEGYLRSARKACRERPWYARLADRYIFALY